MKINIKYTEDRQKVQVRRHLDFWPVETAKTLRELAR